MSGKGSGGRGLVEKIFKTRGLSGRGFVGEDWMGVDCVVKKRVRVDWAREGWVSGIFRYTVEEEDWVGEDLVVEKRLRVDRM